MMTERTLSHDEALELAGLYVLGGLDRAEDGAVRRHLAGCSLEHAEVEQLGSVAQALAFAVEPQDAPAPARQRVLDAVAREAALTAPARVAARTAPPPLASVQAHPPARERGNLLAGLFGARQPQWLALAAAFVLVAALGAWSVQLNQRAAYLDQRADTIARAMAASVTPGAEVAVLRGTGTASAAAGIAVLDPSQHAHMVLVGLPPAPAGQTYQAWQMIEGVPHSAGLLTVDEDGYAVLADVAAIAGIEAIALTLEVAGGVDAPTAAPIVSGALRPSGGGA